VEFEHFQLETEEQNDFLEATQMKCSLNIKEESKNKKLKLFEKYITMSMNFSVKHILR